jgi:MFS family permease
LINYQLQNMAFCILAGYATDRFGMRYTALGGTVCMGFGVIGASFAQDLWHLYATFSVGVGLSAFINSHCWNMNIDTCFIRCRFCAGSCDHWYWTMVSAEARVCARRGYVPRDSLRDFSDNVSLAPAVAGSGIGALIWPIAFAEMLSNLGWRNTFRIFGTAQVIVLTCCALSYRPRINFKRTVRYAEFVRSRQLQLLYITITLISYGFMIPFYHIVPYARDRGVSEQVAAWIVSIMGFASTTGRLAMGMASDWFGPGFMLRLSVAMLGVATIYWSFTFDVLTIALFGVLYGLFVGSIPAILPLVVAQVSSA